MTALTPASSLQRWPSRVMKSPVDRVGAYVPGGAAAHGERKPLRERVTGFFHDVRVEMRKVSWPTREQLVAFTTVAVVTSVVLTLVVFGLDVALKELVFFVIGGTDG